MAYRIVLIGCGPRGRRHALGLQSEPMALSALEHRRVDLPIAPVPVAILERLRAALPDGPASP